MSSLEIIPKVRVPGVRFMYVLNGIRLEIASGASLGAYRNRGFFQLKNA